MSIQQITEQSPAESATDAEFGLGRRAFLEASLKGVGIGAAGAAGLGGWTLSGNTAAATVAAADNNWSSASSPSAATGATNSETPADGRGPKRLDDT